MDGNNHLELDLESEHNDDDLESDLLSDSEDKSWLCRRNVVVPNSFRTGRKLENTNLLHSSPPVEFLKLFITDDFVTKMAEQTNFYAVQRGAPRSFKPVSDRVINLYHYTNIHTDSGRRPETIFGCSLCKTHPCSELCFAQFHAKIHNIYKKNNKRLIMR